MARLPYWIGGHGRIEGAWPNCPPPPLIRHWKYLSDARIATMKQYTLVDFGQIVNDRKKIAEETTYSVRNVLLQLYLVPRRSR